MKRWIKIGAITIGSLLTCTIIASLTACYLIFTPSRLTSIVNKVADKYLMCEMHVDEIDLTLFSSFPDISLQLNGTTLINPYVSGINDTVASIQLCEAVLDIKHLLKDNAITLRSLHIDKGTANLYIQEDGNSNFMIIATDTTTTAEDSTTFNLPDIDIQKFTVNNINITYRNDVLQQNASIKNFSLALNGKFTNKQLEAALKGSLGQLTISMAGDSPINTSASNMTVEMGGNMKNDEGKLSCKFSVGAISASAADINADIDDIEWQLSGTINNKHIAANTTLSTNPIEICMEGEEPITATISTTQLKASAQSDGRHIELTPTLTMQELCLLMNKEQMLSKANISLHMPIQTDTTLQNIAINSAELSLDKYLVEINGELSMPDTATINADIHFNTNYWDIPSLLTLVPDSYSHLLDGIDIKGGTSLRGKANGGIHHGKSTIKQAEAILALHNIDLCYNDSIDLKSNTANIDITYTGSNDKAIGKLQANNLNVNMTGLADAKLTDISGAFTLKQAMRMPDGFIDAQAHLTSSDLTASMDTMGIYTEYPVINLVMKATKATSPTYRATLNCDTLHAHIGSMFTASTGLLKAEGEATYDASATEILAQWDPRMNFDLQTGHITTSMMTLPIDVPHIQFDYADGHFTINDSRIILGKSDFALQGDVTNIDAFINKTDLLKAELDFTSGYTDVTQLMDLISGLGSSDTTEVMELEEVPTLNAATEEDDPFIVPLGIDVRLNTDIRSANVGGFTFDEIGGQVTVKDGILILEEMGFTSDAARMQLTAMYKSPRTDHLFLGFDFHLLDIEIDQLIRMIPDVDSIIPMLSAFDGEAQFHLAAETYLRSNYDPKLSTLRAAGAIEGKDLVILDNSTFNQIAKLLMFEKKTENKVDSIAVELSVFRDKVTLFPFLIAMDDYKAVIGGRHNIDNDLSFNYHISLTDCPLPVRLGLDVNGTLDDMKFTLAPCKYAHLYRPEKQNAVQERTLQLKQIISESLKDNVKEQPKRQKE